LKTLENVQSREGEDAAAIPSCPKTLEPEAPGKREGLSMDSDAQVGGRLLRGKDKGMLLGCELGEFGRETSQNEIRTQEPNFRAFRKLVPK